jgi:DNA primase
LRFSDDFINRVRDANNIVDIISQSTELKRAGRSLMGLCPFPNHREKTASFSVSEDKQVYHCFGCKKSGNIVSFLEEMRGMSFREAIEYLAERASISIPKEESSVFIDDQRDQKKLLLKLNKLAGFFFKNTLNELPENHSVRAYMQKRGITPDLAEEFKIGYAPADWSNLANALTAKHAPLQEADRLGLIRKRSSGDGYFDMFRDRLMFPILSLNQEVIGFGGRILGEGQPKYLNSPESPVFHKGNTLYGLHASAKHIRAQDEVIVVEGYMDLIALYSHGFQNVVATLGTALTHDHAKLIGRFTKKVIVLFDGDSAGQAAAERSLPILLSEGLMPRGLTLPDKMDPDDAVQKLGRDEFQKTLLNAGDLFLLQLEKCMRGYKGQPSEKIQIFEKLASVLIVIKDVRLRDLYSRAVIDQLSVEEKWFRLSLAEFAKKNALQQTRYSSSSREPAVAAPLVPPEEKKAKLTVKSPKKDEVLLLNLMLSKPQLMDLALESDIIQNLGQSELAEIFEITKEVYRQDKSNFAKLTILLSDKLEDPNLVTQHLHKGFMEDLEVNGEKLVKDCVEKIKNRHLRQQGKRLTQELKLEQDPSKLEQFMNIQRERHSLK